MLKDIEKVARFYEKGQASQATYKYTSIMNENNGDLKTIEIEGAGFSDVIFKKTKEGFKLSFTGTWEEMELLNFFAGVRDEIKGL